MAAVEEILQRLHISFERYEHPPVFTVAEAEHYDRNIPGAKSKNLFLRNKKGTAHYLIVAESRASVNLKKLAGLLGEGNLSFASPERLRQYLGVAPGSVSPFGLINDTTKSVRVLVDRDLLSTGHVGFHPNDNTATFVLTADDFRKYLEWTGNDIRYISIQEFMR